MRILFVGNSYTYFNDMPRTLQGIAAAEGLCWTVESVTKGGWSFAQYADPENVMHAPLAEKLQEKWDAIILQEQSYRPISDRANFLGGAKGVCTMMQQKPEKLLFYATWGRKDGCPLLDELKLTRLEMTAELHEAYADAAAQNEGSLSDVGGAFAYVYERYPEIELYTPDLSHPSAAGSYLGALIHFHSLTGTLPASVRHLPEKVTLAQAETLLSAARDYLG